MTTITSALKRFLHLRSKPSHSNPVIPIPAASSKSKAEPTAAPTAAEPATVTKAPEPEPAPVPAIAKVEPTSLVAATASTATSISAQVLAEAPFPVEIYLQIITPDLGTDTLIALLRVSRLLNLIATPILHAMFRSVDIDLLGTHNACCPDDIILRSRSPRPITPMHKFYSEKLLSILKAPSSDHFRHTIHLTVTQHNFHTCRSLSIPNMPSLQTLRIRPSCCEGYTNLCCSRLFDDACCPLIASLRPRQLIIGGCSKYHGFSGNPWRVVGIFNPPSVKHLIVLVGLFSGFVRNRKHFGLWRVSCRNALEKISFVLTCGEEGLADVAVQGQLTANEAIHAIADRGSLAESVMQSCPNWAPVIEIVGSESAEGDWAEIKGRIEKGHTLAMVRQHSPERVVFDTEAHFAEREWWYGGLQAELKASLTVKVRQVAWLGEASAQAMIGAVSSMEDQTREYDGQQVNEICYDCEKDRHCPVHRHWSDDPRYEYLD